MTPEFWDKRYRENKLAYGLEPNEFFAQFLKNREPGRLLLPGEGEGRNAIFAAARGWQVDAADFSPAGREKALDLARHYQVNINYLIGNLSELSLPENYYDAIAVIFLHLPPETRQIVHRRLVSFLKPGGEMLLEVFSKEQINHQSGGPKHETMLYSTEELREDFNQLNVDSLVQTNILLDEGRFHQGMASVLRMVAQKV